MQGGGGRRAFRKASTHQHYAHSVACCCIAVLLHVAAVYTTACCSRLPPSSNSVCQRSLSNSEAVSVQDYSLLRDGTASRDVFHDVEGGKKRSASALRLLGLAKAEALVRPARCPLREAHAGRLPIRSADAGALSLCPLKVLRAFTRTLCCCSAGAACARGELRKSGMAAAKHWHDFSAIVPNRHGDAKQPDGVKYAHAACQRCSCCGAAES